MGNCNDFAAQGQNIVELRIKDNCDSHSIEYTATRDSNIFEKQNNNKTEIPKLEEENSNDILERSHFDGEKLETSSYIYHGEVLDKKPNGYGNFTFYNGQNYKGYTYNGKFEGQGQLKRSDGFEYTGEFKQGEFNGYGNATWPNGCIYEGQFENGLFHGYGEFNWPNGKIYKGPYLYGVKHGNGIIYMTDGSKFEGIWDDGILQNDNKNPN